MKIRKSIPELLDVARAAEEDLDLAKYRRMEADSRLRNAEQLFKNTAQSARDLRANAARTAEAGYAKSEEIWLDRAVRAEKSRDYYYSEMKKEKACRRECLSKVFFAKYRLFYAMFDYYAARSDRAAREARSKDACHAARYERRKALCDDACNRLRDAALKSCAASNAISSKPEDCAREVGYAEKASISAMDAVDRVREFDREVRRDAQIRRKS